MKALGLLSEGKKISVTADDICDRSGERYHLIRNKISDVSLTIIVDYGY